MTVIRGRAFELVNKTSNIAGWGFSCLNLRYDHIARPYVSEATCHSLPNPSNYPLKLLLSKPFSATL